MPPDTIRVAATKITIKIHNQVTARVLRTQNSVLTCGVYNVSPWERLRRILFKKITNRITMWTYSDSNPIFRSIVWRTDSRKSTRCLHIHASIKVAATQMPIDEWWTSERWYTHYRKLFSLEKGDSEPLHNTTHKRLEDIVLSEKSQSE